MNRDIQTLFLVLLPFLLLQAWPMGASPQHADHSKYAGMETREIKSLSAEDVQQLTEGHGWGLSLVAELNGVPGPRHLLELQRELDLSAEQVSGIEAVYRTMKNAAVPLGEELVRLERELDAAFANGSIDDRMLRDLLNSIAQTRSDLRYVHLAAHLETPLLLSRDQIDEYNRLRGYDSGDPCATVPPGHDPELWKKHNHCEEG